MTTFICALYAHILGRSGIQPDDDFFADLNGDSLAAAQVIVVLEDLFEINVIEAFFDDSSPETISTIVEQHLHGRLVAGWSWRDGSSLVGNALKDDVARLRQAFAASQRSVPEVNRGGG